MNVHNNCQTYPIDDGIASDGTVKSITTLTLVVISLMVHAYPNQYRDQISSTITHAQNVILALLHVV